MFVQEPDAPRSRPTATPSPYLAPPVSCRGPGTPGGRAHTHERRPDQKVTPFGHLAHTRLAVDEPSHATPFGTQTSPHNHVRGMVGPLGHYVEHLGGNPFHMFAHTTLARTSRSEHVHAVPQPKAPPWPLHSLNPSLTAASRLAVHGHCPTRT